jgi:hypothetical protein
MSSMFIVQSIVVTIINYGRNVFLVQATCLRGQPLDAGDAAAVLDVVHHRLAVQVVDGCLAVDPAAQNQRINVRPVIN